MLWIYEQMYGANFAKSRLLLTLFTQSILHRTTLKSRVLGWTQGFSHGSTRFVRSKDASTHGFRSQKQTVGIIEVNFDEFSVHDGISCILNFP